MVIGGAGYASALALLSFPAIHRHGPVLCVNRHQVPSMPADSPQSALGIQR